MISRRTHGSFSGGSQIPSPAAIVAPGGVLRGRASRSHAIRRKRADGCGNAGAMETTERFPPRLGNLAQTARFPHFHKPILVGVFVRTNGTERNDAVTRDR